MGHDSGVMCAARPTPQRGRRGVPPSDEVKAADFIASFVCQLRRQSEELHAYGASEASKTCSRAADDLEDQFNQWWQSELSITEASEESGYSRAHLRDMVRSGSIPGIKSGGELTIRRCDLPRRPKAVTDRTSVLGEALVRARNNCRDP